MAPLLLADSLASVLQDPSQPLVGSAEPVGFEAFRVADGRRSQFDYWQPGVTNVDAFLTITCDQARGANCLVLDRGHNLAGKMINLFGSQDNFATQVTVLSVTVPTAGGQIAGVVSGGSVVGGGATTEEGACLITFPAAGHTYWRVCVPPHGARPPPDGGGPSVGLALPPAAAYPPPRRRPPEFPPAAVR